MKKSFLQPSWNKSSKAKRFIQLKHFFENKDILDIGCAVGHGKPDWMHESIKGVARSIYGIDLDKGAIEKIKTKGFDVGYGDAQNFDIDKKFNLIHAGELIEHLGNPESFLLSAGKHLTEDGMILITTPNGLRINNFIYASTGGLQVNFQHTCWFCEYTLKTLVERAGLEVVETGYLRHEAFGLFRKIALKMRSAFLPDRVAWNTLYVVARHKRT